MEVELRKVSPIPRWEGREVRPFTAKEYGRRFAALRCGPRAKGVECVVVYGDKLHFGDIDFFTGLQIKWEEALLVVGPEQGSSTLLLGNEMYRRLSGVLPLRGGSFARCTARASASPARFAISVAPGSAPSRRACERRGLPRRSGRAHRMEIGSSPTSSRKALLPISCPRCSCGRSQRPRTPSASRISPWIMIDPENGLRTINDAHRIAWMEGACSRVSNALASLIEGLAPGMSEADAPGRWRYRGERLSADPVVLFGRSGSTSGSPRRAAEPASQGGQGLHGHRLRWRLRDPRRAGRSPTGTGQS